METDPEIHDDDLVDMARAGDQSAWALLLQKYEPLIEKAVRKSVRKGHDEDDSRSVVHERFMAAVRCYDRNAPASFFTFLFNGVMIIGTGRAYVSGPIRLPVSAFKTDPIKAKSALRCASMDAPLCGDPGGRTLHDLLCGKDTNDGEYDAEPALAALKRLPSRYREIVEMRVYGLTLEEVGERIGVTRERVRQIETKAIAKLRGWLTPTPETPEPLPTPKHYAVDLPARTGRKLTRIEQINRFLRNGPRSRHEIVAAIGPVSCTVTTKNFDLLESGLWVPKGTARNPVKDGSLERKSTRRPPKDKYARRRHKAKAAGLCIVCGKLSDGRAYCPSCREKRRRWRRNRILRKLGLETPTEAA